MIVHTERISRKEYFEIFEDIIKENAMSVLGENELEKKLKDKKLQKQYEKDVFSLENDYGVDFDKKAKKELIQQSIILEEILKYGLKYKKKKNKFLPIVEKIKEEIVIYTAFKIHYATNNKSDKFTFFKFIDLDKNIELICENKSEIIKRRQEWKKYCI